MRKQSNEWQRHSQIQSTLQALKRFHGFPGSRCNGPRAAAAFLANEIPVNHKEMKEMACEKCWSEKWEDGRT